MIVCLGCWRTSEQRATGKQASASRMKLVRVYAEPAAPVDVQESWEEAAEAPAPAAAARSNGKGAASTQPQQPPGIGNTDNRASKPPEEEWPSLSGNVEDGWSKKGAANDAQPAEGDEQEFDPNILWYGIQRIVFSHK